MVFFCWYAEGVTPNCFWKLWENWAGLLNPTSIAISEIFPNFCSIKCAAFVNLIRLIKSPGDSPVKETIFLWRTERLTFSKSASASTPNAVSDIFLFIISNTFCKNFLSFYRNPVLHTIHFWSLALDAIKSLNCKIHLLNLLSLYITC